MDNILYEDEFLIALNKANNLLTHHSHYSRNIDEVSLAQMVRKYCRHKVHPIHRLDRKTSGVILFAKDPDTCKLIQEQFFQGTVEKKYISLVRGHVHNKLEINSPLKNELSGEYQDAESHLAPIEIVEYEKAVLPYPTSRYSLVELFPKTGRTHQLRKHMNKIAHPIIGDPKHGNRHHNHAFQEWFGHSMLFLHAKTLKIKHPISNENLIFEAIPPSFWNKNLGQIGFITTL